jgi:D-psicose/D-tagatose/L-ribulose 3-epimerase
MSGRIGIHSLVFTDAWTEANAAEVCRVAADLGYDLVEVLIFDPATIDIPMTKRVVGGSGLGLRLGMALSPATDISSPDAATAAAGEATVARCLAIAAELGAPAVSGITYAAFNAYSAAPTTDQRRRVAEALARLDRRAGELGVRIGIEPVNRYESYMVNSIDQAADLIRDADAGNAFIHIDTFHMAIEEADIAATILRHADRLGYVHLAENNRGVPGSGLFDFAGLFRALAQAGYAGDFTIETFSPTRLGPATVGAIRLWRTPWREPVEAAGAALAFVRTQLAAAALAVAPW